MNKYTAFLIALSLCQPVSLAAQTLHETKLTASDGGANDTFGFAVALCGDYALIGASGKDGARGAAYLFQRDPAAPSGWREKQQLLARDGTIGDSFGFAVALTPDYAMISARDDNELGEGAGAAYIFRRQDSTWIQTPKLTVRLGGSLDYFGNAIALSADYALIGAPGERFERGAAYIFKRTTGTTGEIWQESNRLQAANGASGDSFGNTVALVDSYAIVGAYSDDEGGDNSGAVYTFQRERTGGSDTWVQRLKLKPADGRTGDYFGVAVAASGSELIVGAFGADDQAEHAGAAYIFSRQDSGGTVQWKQQSKLVAGDGAANDDFGCAVALSGDFVLAGALMQYSQGKGAAYLFKRDHSQWREARKFTASDGELNDRFGNAVILHGDRVLIGARFEDEKGNNAGAGYLYEGLSSLVHVSEPVAAPPLSFALEQNYPNPFNPATTIGFSLARDAFVTLKVYDTHGIEIATIASTFMAAGRHQVQWQAGDIASGIYFYRLQAGDFVQTQKLVVLK